jgi:predicted nucleic acid-binding protein
VIAGIDSMILVYAGIVPVNKNPRSAKSKELHFRSKLLLAQLARKKATLLLPAVALSELLIPVPEAEKGTLIAELTKRFLCQPFDIKSAAIAASLWTQHKQKKLPPDEQYKERHVLRADCMIVASAYAAGATDFFSHDNHCRSLAALVMKAHDLPTNDSEDMFLLGDIQRGEV